MCTPEFNGAADIMVIKRAESLQRMVSAPEGVLENRERLEQLRLLELGMTCHATVIDKIKLIDSAPADINTKEEYEEYCKYTSL